MPVGPEGKWPCPATRGRGHHGLTPLPVAGLRWLSCSDDAPHRLPHAEEMRAPQNLRPWLSPWLPPPCLLPVPCDGDPPGRLTAPPGPPRAQDSGRREVQGPRQAPSRRARVTAHLHGSERRGWGTVTCRVAAELRQLPARMLPCSGFSAPGSASWASELTSIPGKGPSSREGGGQGLTSPNPTLPTGPAPPRPRLAPCLPGACASV